MFRNSLTDSSRSTNTLNVTVAELPTPPLSLQPPPELDGSTPSLSLDGLHNSQLQPNPVPSIDSNFRTGFSSGALSQNRLNYPGSGKGKACNAKSRHKRPSTQRPAESETRRALVLAILGSRTRHRSSRSRSRGAVFDLLGGWQVRRGGPV